jgi:hypothetical protein
MVIGFVNRPATGSGISAALSPYARNLNKARRISQACRLKDAFGIPAENESRCR